MSIQHETLELQKKTQAQEMKNEHAQAEVHQED